MHAQIASELGEFTMVDIVQGINRKTGPATPSCVLAIWMWKILKNVLKKLGENSKKKERRDNGQKNSARGCWMVLPKDFSSSSSGTRVPEKRAQRVGFLTGRIFRVWLDKVRGGAERVFRKLPTGRKGPKSWETCCFSLVKSGPVGVM